MADLVFKLGETAFNPWNRYLVKHKQTPLQLQ